MVQNPLAVRKFRISPGQTCNTISVVVPILQPGSSHRKRNRVLLSICQGRPFKCFDDRKPGFLFRIPDRIAIGCIAFDDRVECIAVNTGYASFDHAVINLVLTIIFRQACEGIARFVGRKINGIGRRRRCIISRLAVEYYMDSNALRPILLFDLRYSAVCCKCPGLVDRDIYCLLGIGVGERGHAAICSRRFQYNRRRGTYNIIHTFR